MIKSSDDQASLEDISSEKSTSALKNQNIQRIGRPSESMGGKGTISDLKKLYASQKDQRTE